MRTPPLWGVRVRDPMWHDGRVSGGTFSQRILDAIELHPDWAIPYQLLSVHLAGLGRLDEAIAWERISMEYTAEADRLGGSRAGCRGRQLLPEDAELTVYSDSQLCVKTVNEWAEGWAKRGWRRKSGPIANLELVKELYALSRSHPRVRIQWIKAHDGSRWNEYADALATTYLR